MAGGPATSRLSLRSGVWILSLAWALGVTACASHASYPQNWPARLGRAQGCEHLAGEYADRGKTGGGSEISLARLVLGDTSKAWPAESVRLAFPEKGRMKVDVLAEWRDPVAVVLTSSQIECREGLLRIRAGGNWVMSGSQLGVSVGRRSYSLDLEDAGGSLVLRRKTSTKGVWIAVPFSFSEDEWFRFERVVSK
jgi:hypothetical protein